MAKGRVAQVIGTVVDIPARAVFSLKLRSILATTG